MDADLSARVFLALVANAAERAQQRADYLDALDRLEDAAYSPGRSALLPAQRRLRHQWAPAAGALAGAALSSVLLPAHVGRERIITLNLGLGRDSLAMLGLLVEGRLVAEGRVLAPEDIDAVVFSDPGAEWAHTLALLPRVRRFCMRHGLRFLHLQKPSREAWTRYLAELPPPRTPARRAALAGRPWREAEPATIEEKAAGGWYHLRPPILDDYQSRATIASRASKDCTLNHKVEPIRKLVSDLSVERFGLDNRAWGAQVRAGGRWPHLNLIGIAADEAERALFAHPLLGGTGPWYATEAYPLLEAGIPKADEQPILARHGFADARKSGCFLCPFQPVGWYWALRETDPEGWASVVAYEAAALAENPRMFLVGKTPIDVAVTAWRAKNPAATVEAVLSKNYARACERPADREAT